MNGFYKKKKKIGFRSYVKLNVSSHLSDSAKVRVQKYGESISLFEIYEMFLA